MRTGMGRELTRSPKVQEPERAGLRIALTYSRAMDEPRLACTAPWSWPRLIRSVAQRVALVFVALCLAVPLASYRLPSDGSRVAGESAADAGLLLPPLDATLRQPTCRRLQRIQRIVEHDLRLGQRTP
jgi:hypothetical protein